MAGEDDEAIEVIAREICITRGGNPDAKEPGGYTVPYDADYIGESNTHYDGHRPPTGSGGYREPWSFLWRSSACEAISILKALREAGFMIEKGSGAPPT